MYFMASSRSDILPRFALNQIPEIFLKAALRAAFKNISVLLKASIGYRLKTQRLFCPQSGQNNLWV